ncbi:phenylacetate--CoA ligase family protein [Kitasatospora sp. DSM 101779]|uniref:phenylacetate--CoA ligase family protein n=1 Tax=Kitasatospora sp. DSM 101779 TaxID=2853165 RepID=UPI0021D8E76C|nr:AMP-binding protein [Kitasatospora sp. DSM 101779]MCU7826993.1 AMP-binding protein [Kitasatospora sp. DSM 101779]
MFSLTPDAVEPRLHVARRTLERLRTVPELAPRYAGHTEPHSLPDLAALPPLAKDDLNTALAHLAPKAEHGATWLFQSGGSTGAPKIGYAPTGFYMAGVHAHWQPLGPDDVFVNAWGAGRMWGAHFLAAALADLSGCQIIAVGSVAADEYPDWLSFFAARGVTAIGGTPSVLRLWFARARAAGITLPDLRKALWLGEAWQPQLAEDLAAVAPQARRHGMFGSTETWVVGTNGPECPADTFHTLPEQLVHVGPDDLLDFTTLNPEMLNPVLRYRTGDAGRLVACPCGRPGPAMQVLGRRDSVVQVRGLGLHVEEVVARAEREPGVAQAQVLVTEQGGRACAVEVLLLTAPGTEVDTERLRKEILSATFTLSTAFQHDPQSFRVRAVDALISNGRTGKTSDLVVREDS